MVIIMMYLNKEALEKPEYDFSVYRNKVLSYSAGFGNPGDPLGQQRSHEIAGDGNGEGERDRGGKRERERGERPGLPHSSAASRKVREQHRFSAHCSTSYIYT
jgi:hypothetical protein